jgi:glycosyltransferase involved in cell wall biosynthesis
VRIVLYHNIFSAQAYGGISRYYVEVADRLRQKSGVSLSVYSFIHINEYLRARPEILSLGAYLPSVRRIEVRRRLNGVLTRAALAISAPDIFHETYFTAERLPRGRTRVVTTVYDMIHERYPAQFGSQDPTSDWKRRGVSESDHVCCISESTRRDVIELLGVPEEKTTVIRLAQSMSEVKADHGHEVQWPFILYVGYRRGYKNFDAVIEAMGRSSVLRGVGIVCYGGGPFSADELSAFERHGLKAVHMAGGDEVLAALYDKAQVFVYPSLYEGFGIPPLEAMARGCPVVSSGTSSLPEVVGDAAEIFDPGSTEELRCALERVVTDSARREELVRLGRQRAALFSWDRTAEETLQMYRKLC